MSGTLCIVGDQIACKACHDALKPQCPYCGKDIARKKRPTRRSSFKCKHCGESINVEPTQPLYDSQYLTDTQLRYVHFFETLDSWVFVSCDAAAYEGARTGLEIQFGYCPKPGDVLWRLMNDAMLNDCQDVHGAKSVRELMDSFKEFEASIKSK